MLRRLVALLLTASAVVCLTARPGVRAQAAPAEAQVDKVFARWTTSTPGCAVGVAVGGRPVLERAYGRADLEHDVANTAETIFEAGSVSKQFTAAAVMLLARDGKLSLDDPIRKYLPEVPDYGRPMRIRHLLTHTSGLRDWGSLESIAGWPRTSRVYTHDHVLEIVSQQRALNFPTGTRWSYSNTGYNLAAILVARVSGQPFATFTRDRIFAPLGMTHTSWRDDFTRVVRGRAIAYADERDGFHSDMPFENVHGNGGLLTTVGDLLKWNGNFDHPVVGDATFTAAQQRPGTFDDGVAHDYAMGLRIGRYRAVREVAHSGTTASYQAYLARYPDNGLSVAVLCNAGSASATQYAHAVADAYLGGLAVVSQLTTAPYDLTARDVADVAGLYRNTVTGTVLTLAGGPGRNLRAGATTLVPRSAIEFVAASGTVYRADGRGGLTVTDAFTRVDTYARVEMATPASATLAALAGTYVSDEVETTLTLAVEGGGLVAKRRPATVIKLAPLYRDAFSAPGLGTVVFRRDSSGRVVALSVSQDRVWDLRFRRK